MLKGSGSIYCQERFIVSRTPSSLQKKSSRYANVYLVKYLKLKDFQDFNKN